ncbi:hypothetical protein QM012_000102 [Aureobasidium pullulans]|uniref:CID domain-containing protein n=1 Tax=Aureobasidium pullulans TaxID=5580 RepID=A0ABR0TVE5_AURPU
MSTTWQSDKLHEPIPPCPPTPRLRPVSDWDDPNLPLRAGLPRFPPDALDSWWPLYLGPSLRTCAIALAEHAKRIEQLNNCTTPSQQPRPAREPVQFRQLSRLIQSGAAPSLSVSHTTNEHWAVNRPPPPKLAPWIPSNQLQHLNASVTSAQKAAVWAIKYREWDEDLHSCILENLERNSLNNRANIFYFFETLCDVASAANHIEFVRMMERDILRIVDLVAPEDGSGAANVKVVRKVLRNLAGKKYLQQQTVDELEECIKDRDNIGGVGGVASPEEAVRHSNGNVRVEKRQVEQRIEEDRERHKRLREGIWAVNEDEFDKTWVDAADLNQDDYRTAMEEEAERKQYAGLHRTELLGA